MQRGCDGAYLHYQACGSRGRWIWVRGQLCLHWVPGQLGLRRETLSQKTSQTLGTAVYVDTYLYTDMCTPCEMSSLSFLIFLTFLCSAVSFRAALASSCALSWQEGHPQVRKALQVRGRAKGEREQRRTPPPLQYGRGGSAQAGSRPAHTYFCLFAIWALTWASTFVGSWTASVPNTRIKFEIRTTRREDSNQSPKCFLYVGQFGFVVVFCTQTLLISNLYSKLTFYNNSTLKIPLT